jgi:hypothetical protein
MSIFTCTLHLQYVSQARGRVTAQVCAHLTELTQFLLLMSLQGLRLCLCFSRPAMLCSIDLMAYLNRSVGGEKALSLAGNIETTKFV